jgi:hypothetical protein
MPSFENAAASSSVDSLTDRLATKDGQQQLLHLANLIARSAVESLPPELRQSLTTPAGIDAFRAAWPGIVEDFLKWGAAVSNTGAVDACEEAGAIDLVSSRE